MNIPFTILDQLNNLEFNLNATNTDETTAESFEYLRERISDYFERSRDYALRREFRRQLRRQLIESFDEFNAAYYDEIAEYTDTIGETISNDFTEYANRIKRIHRGEYHIDLYATLRHLFDGNSLFWDIDETYEDGSFDFSPDNYSY